MATCSTTPRTDAVHDGKNRAAEYADSGNRYLNEGNISDALTFYNLALDENLKVDHLPGIVSSYNNIGKLNLAIGRIDAAETLFLKAYEIAAPLQDPIPKAMSAGFLGELALFRDDQETAQKRLEEALGYLARKTQTIEAAVLYHQMGSVRKSLEDYEGALVYFKKAQKINKRKKAFAELGSNYYMIASIYSKQEKYEDAQEYIQLALDTDKLVENSVGIAKDYLAMGLIAQKLDKIEMAFDYFKRSFRVYRALSFAQDMKKVLGHLEQSAKTLGYDDEAQTYTDAITALETGQ